LAISLLIPVHFKNFKETYMIDKLKAWCTATLVFAGLVAGGAKTVMAQTVYQVPAMADYSGPFAAIMPMVAPGREAVFAWWNAEVGAKLGVKLELKHYDTRYDTAQSASLWPGVLATKPLVGLSLGGPDTAALQQRLPSDKVPMILGSGANGFGWRPNQWILTTRATFVHESAAFVEWYQKNKLGGTRPVKIAVFASEASPTFADIGKGMAAYAKAKPGIVEMVEVVYVDPQPTDVTLQLRRVLNAGAEVILVPTTIQQAVAVKRAMQALGKKVPIMYSMQNSPAMLQKLLGSLDVMEGDYEAHGQVIATDEDSDSKRFYDLLVAKYGLKAPWHALTNVGINSALVLVRTVESAARKSGSDKLTGELIYRTLLDSTVSSKELFGFIASDISFTTDTPFPAKAPRINVGQVVNSKIRTVGSAVVVPVLEKW
jgi:branched-chain amino acid transport system substrate-binding protein